jgi:hypothetical protein
MYLPHIGVVVVGFNLTGVNDSAFVRPESRASRDDCLGAEHPIMHRARYRRLHDGDTYNTWSWKTKGLALALNSIIYIPNAQHRFLSLQELADLSKPNFMKFH